MDSKEYVDAVSTPKKEEAPSYTAVRELRKKIAKDKEKESKKEE